ncbi:MAG: CsgG/HfaB family protein [Desulfuromonadaceae bacterium]|nr:CsgG/HfaB family protein [Desulfuromonadaceae bacterium]MDD2855374.1 CsgG/HfaB family protein [Desulfuromonadaceae bacterium]
MKIIQRFASVVIALTLIIPLSVSAAELSKGEKDTIFIGQLKIQPSVVEMAERKNRLPELRRIFNSLETQFISSLNSTRVFQLVERSRKSDIELEQAFAAASVDPDDKNAAQAGKMAGAKFAFLPQIDGFEDSSETAEYQGIGRASMTRRLFISATVQVVDTTTGKMLPDSPSIQLTKTEEIENARLGQLSGSDQIIVALAREMASKLSQELVGFLRPAKVLSVTGRQIMFNRGTEAGFNKGDLLDIYAVQDVKDDDTGETFRNEVPVGRAIIKRIDKNQSYANIDGDDMGITKGCVVRFLKTAAERAADGREPTDGTQPDFESKTDSENTPGSSEKPLKWK